MEQVYEEPVPQYIFLWVLLGEKYMVEKKIMFGLSKEKLGRIPFLKCSLLKK